MSVLNEMMLREVRIWTIKDNYRLGDDIQSKVLAFAFGLSAEIERNLISQRTKEALARKKAEGVQLGRRKETEKKYYYMKLTGIPLDGDGLTTYMPDGSIHPHEPGTHPDQ